ncbi:ABC transporter substrate-binding protein [Pseudooceanicola sp. CBS1P-1]|uniref:Thiamine pyrimidine synthase n=1 Tax=Pseudooceanicola albus TaxID=2692189 RepID=A0A6L7G531_9RHOB|nr:MULTISPECIES: ABC transporter substrate-binding protein [Pseudooceanicola]MBT9385071.1 ABC transporter substrate-binding protein [Pseudooceanicola endophyticus]MXN18637.1 ABC transporter substrate-binding protein [Pseudooceanicola albus]
MRKILTASLLAAVSVFGAASAHANEAVSLRLKWLTQAQFAGVYVAKAKGFYSDAGLDMTIQPGGPNINVETLVASGADTFGIASGTEGVLASRAKGLPIKAIGMDQQITPYVYVTKPDSGIKTAADFKGKKVATWFTGPQYVLYSVLAANGIDRKDVDIISQSVTLQPFIDGDFDVATATLYNEYNTLLEKGLTDLTVISPEDSGMTSQQDAIITSDKMIAEKPEVVQAFLNATLRGWKYAFQHPDEAVDIVMDAGTGLDRDHQAKMLDKVKDLMTGSTGASKGLGYLNLDAISAVEKNLVKYEAITKPVEISDAFDPSFWDKVPAEDKLMDK